MKRSDNEAPVNRTRQARIRAAHRRRQEGASPTSPREIRTKMVPDPWEPGATIIVPCNTREGPIEHMASRGRLNSSQRAAADRYRELYERSRITPIRSADTTREPVDGGGGGIGISDGLVAAAKTLNDANRSVGRVGAQLLTAVVGEGVSIQLIAERYGAMSGRRAEGYVTGRLIEAIDGLVAFFRMEAKGGSAKIIAEDVESTGPTVEWAVGRHGDLVEKTW